MMQMNNINLTDSMTWENVPRRPTSVNYKYTTQKEMPARFIFECAQKLEMKPLTSATAAILYHRFFRELDDTEYDPYMIACSCLYLAGKIKDDKVRKRDVINVAHNTINRDATPLEPCDEYWSMWDTIVQAELFIARMLKFDMTIVHPHKYMLHYMKSLQDLFGAKEWHSMPVAKAAAAFLQDFHHSSKILDYKPAHTAVCCLALAFQVYGVQVPLMDETDETTNWYNVFCPELTRETYWEILENVMDVYDIDTIMNEN
ncbi:cyclin-Q [Anopheles maculipalpis]|uniref:cyclin-Q n=1 Tax=Anopheles maculipalpis TaxID=1496333 RepID=UPI002158CCE8|nr:cyclin-Q [Anopheles maculipalpis]